MVKNILILCSVFFINVYGDVYKENCLACHEKLPVSIDKYFYKYLLIYSSEADMKHAIINYLKVPVKETTVMSDSFIRRFGVKETTLLNEEQLREAVDAYWEKYKIFGKLK